MSPLPSPCQKLLIMTASLLGWIVVLSVALKLLFGAGVSGGWLIVGTMFSITIFSTGFMLKEFKEAILLPNHFGIGQEKPVVQHQTSTPVQSKHEIPCLIQALVDPSLEYPRRIALGLNPGLSLANRRRQNSRTSSGTARRASAKAPLNNLDVSPRNQLETLSA